MTPHPPSPLLPAALLGINRSPKLPPAPHPALTADWATLSQHPDPAAAHLAAAALEATLLTGLSPYLENPPQLPEPAPPEPNPPLPAALLPIINRLLRSSHPAALEECLTLAIERSWIAPASLLTELAPLATTNPIFQEKVTRLAGTRAPWLATHLPALAWLAESQIPKENLPDSHWHTGTESQRLAYLRQLRATDPLAASALLTAGWKTASPREREKFTQLASSDPQSCDIAWLENLALKERRQSTKSAARRALHQLPKSPTYQRAATRLQSVLFIKKGHLTAHFPKSFDESWLPDGLTEKTPSDLGPRAWWFIQILSQIPLTHWPSLLNHPAPLDLPFEEQNAEPIVRGLLGSIQNFPTDPNLILNLATKPEVILHHHTRALFHPLTPTQRANALETELQQTNSKTLSPFILADIRDYPILISERAHPNLFSTFLSLWTPHQLKDIALDSRDAQLFATFIAPDSLPAALHHINSLPSLSSPGETFARALELRQSYLIHF